jgi:hypothetical protein
MPERIAGTATQRDADLLKAMMSALDEVANDRGKPKTVGLIILTFPYGDADSRVNYISNGADRKDIVVMLKELIARFEGQPELRGHG